MTSKFRLNLYLGEAQRRHLEAVAERHGIALTDAARRIIDADAERERREGQASHKPSNFEEKQT